MSDYPSKEELAQLRLYGALEAANLELGTDEELLGKRVEILGSGDTLDDAWYPGTVVGFNDHQMWKRSSVINVQLDIDGSLAATGRKFVKLLKAKIEIKELN